MLIGELALLTVLIPEADPECNSLSGSELIRPGICHAVRFYLSAVKTAAYYLKRCLLFTAFAVPEDPRISYTYSNRVF